MTATQSSLYIQHNSDQTTNGIFNRTRTKNFMVWMETQKAQIPKGILRKNDETGGINLPDFRLYYKATVIKTVWYWHKYRNVDQWNKIESPEINPCTYVHVIFGMEAHIYSGEGSLFNTCCWENWSTTCQRMKLEHFLTPFTKIYWKWIKYLNVSPETIKLLRGKQAEHSLTYIIAIFSMTHIPEFSSVQSLSRVRLFVTPWTAARPPCRPLLLLPSIFSSVRVFSSELALCI